MVEALVRQRRRLLLATIAVALAVGYLAGALTLLDRVSRGLDQMSAAGSERADLIVEGEIAYESALEQTRRLVPASVAPSLEGIPGIAAIVPRIEDVAIILDADGDPIVAPGLSEQPLGSNWPDDEQMTPYRFVGEGRPPVSSDEVVIDERSAAAGGFEVGDEVVVVGRAEPRTYQLVGIVTTAEGELPAGSSLALFTTDEARDLFQADENDNRVAIRLEPDADVAAVESSVRAVLPSGAELVDGETGARHRQESITRSFTLIRLLITAFAGLALVVGMVTVANSLTLLYSERRRTFAGLRLVGAHQRQLLTAALVEATMLAAVASLIGAPLGLVLGRLIEAAIGALGTSIPVAGSAVSVPALLGAVVIGTVATVLAAIFPAVRACRVAPIEAVADSPAAPRIPWSVRLVNGALVAVGATVLLSGLMMLGDVTARTAVGVAVAVVLVGGVLAVLPTILSVAVAAGIRLVPTRPAALRRIGARDAVRNRARTAATTGALLMATAVVAGLAVFLASFARSVDGDVGKLVRSELVVDSGTFTRGGLPTDLISELAALPDVAAVSGWQVGRVNAGGLPLRITGVDGDAMDTVLDPGWTDGSATSVSAQGVALEEATALALGLSVGDTLPVTFTSGGVEQLVVEGTYTQGSLLLGEAVVDRGTLLRQVPASVDIAALVALEENTPAAVRAVQELAAEFGVESVLRPDEFVDTRSELLNGFQRVIQWMLLFTLLQALVGVVNTLLLSVGERRREFGLLRATGASRRQLLRLVINEGLAFAAVGTALGLLVGIGGAIAAVRALGSYGISTVELPLGVLAVTSIAAMALGVAAAVVPARWAAAVPPLEAVADAGGDRGSRAARRPRLAVPSFRLPTWARRAGRAGSPAAPMPPPTTPMPSPATPSPLPPPATTAAGPPLFATPSQVPPPATPSPLPPPYVPPAAPPPAEPAATPRPPRRVQGPAPSRSRAERPAIRGRSAPAAADGWVRREPVAADSAGSPAAPPLFAPGPTGAAAAAAARAGDRRASAAAPLDEVVRLRLGDALARLDPATQRTALPVLVPFARELEPDEAVEHLAQGWSKGLMCLVARTDRRVVVVVDRFPDPLVESLHRVQTKVTVYGPPGVDRVSLAVVDGRRLLEVAGVRDSAEARALATPTPRAPSVPEYF
jgi:putative ABC transport system permease protein